MICSQPISSMLLRFAIRSSCYISLLSPACLLQPKSGFLTSSWPKSMKGPSVLPRIPENAPQRQFSFKSICIRWPRILHKVTDRYARKMGDVLTKGDPRAVEMKDIIVKIEDMLHAVETNAVIEEFEDLPDGKYANWNAHFAEVKKYLKKDKLTWHDPPWVFSECYMYARLKHFFEFNKTHIKNDDYFLDDKLEQLNQSTDHLKTIAIELSDWEKSASVDVRSALSRLFQIQLWGNKCDLALTCGDVHAVAERFFDGIAALRPNILADHLDATVDHLLTKCKDGDLHIVLDNASLELFTDIALAEFVITQCLAKRVVFHFKVDPWFVSDALVSDFSVIIDLLIKSPDLVLQKLGRKLASRKEFVFRVDPFWTTGRTFWEMKSVAPKLFEELKSADFVIFKGDLNGRKIIGDRCWPYETPFLTAMQSLAQISFVSLRTMKSETVAGLSKDAVTLVEQRFGKNNLEWLLTGDYAVVQLNLPAGR